MENELETMRGQILGLVGALNAIAAVLPDQTSADAAEVLDDMIAATKDSGLESVVTEAIRALRCSRLAEHCVCLFHQIE